MWAEQTEEEPMGINWGAKIQALLANAESMTNNAGTHTCPTCTTGVTNHRAEFLRSAANYQATAERLMDEYRVAEEEALATDPGSSSPIHTVIRVTSSAYSELEHYYRSVFMSIVRHTGCRAFTEWDNGYVAHVVGYEGDVRYAEFLWTAALLMFSTRIDPRWDDTLPEAENIWRLRNAGIERRVIADRAWGAFAGREASNRSKVQRIYLRECAARGEEARATGLGHQTDVYRDAYARSFRDRLADRLQTARDAVDSERGGLVLHGRSDRVDEAFYDLFPAHRPDPNPAPYVAPEPCPRCTPEKACRKHAWNATDERRWQRWNNSASARAGADSGRHAADGVRIDRGHATPTRMDPGTDRPEIGG